jgi:hypothetical protein
VVPTEASSFYLDHITSQAPLPPGSGSHIIITVSQNRPGLPPQPCYCPYTAHWPPVLDTSPWSSPSFFTWSLLLPNNHVTVPPVLSYFLPLLELLPLPSSSSLPLPPALLASLLLQEALPGHPYRHTPPSWNHMAPPDPMPPPQSKQGSDLSNRQRRAVNEEMSV